MHRLVLGAASVVLACGPLRAELAEPPPNEGATRVAVTGTRVDAEAWAVARGHAVETLVVACLERDGEGRPRVTTHERWSLDGRVRGTRGDAALGKEWERRVRRVLDSLPDPESRTSGSARATLDRLEEALGRSGERTTDGWVVGWTIGGAASDGAAGRSRARTAVVTLRPAPPDGDATPPGDAPAPRGDVTPGPGSGAALPGFPRAGGGEGHGGGAATGESEADGERGARAHGKVVVDLASGGRDPSPPPGDGPPVTPPVR